MDDKASAKEILDDLTRLSQAGRLRYMKALEQGDLIEVLGLSLQVLDDTPQSRKRSRETSEARAEKKGKTENKIVVKQETEAIDVDSDIEAVAAPAPQPQTTTTATRASIQVTRSRRDSPPPSKVQHNIPMVFLLPRTDTLVDLARLPTDVETELRHRFHTMCTGSDWRATRYRGMQSRPQGRLNQEECIRGQFTKQGKRRGRPDGYFTNGGEAQKSADDMCIEKRSPCVHMVEHDRLSSLCMVPLPAGLRVGKKWDELEYWVQLGKFVS